MYRQPQLAGDDIWYLADPDTRGAVAAIERGCDGIRLGDVADVGVGMVSGHDAAYLLDEASLASVPAAERYLVRGLGKARNCARYATDGASAYIFPADITEQDLRADAPWIHTHLRGHRERLDARYKAASSEWFAWATMRNASLFERARDAWKIFVPAIDRSPRARFALTDADVLGAGDVVAIVPKAGRPESVLYLAGWLNSTHVHRWYQAKGSRTGARLRYTQAYLEQIPTPAINPVDPTHTALHARIVGLVGDRLAGRGAPDVIDAQIDEMFARHLGIR